LRTCGIKPAGICRKKGRDGDLIEPDQSDQQQLHAYSIIEIIFAAT
jgi:hypothetical protein